MPSHQAEEKSSTEGPIILYVEDEEDLIFVTNPKLINGGFRVETAETKAEGLSRLERTRPDLVLLDLMLPDGSGLDILTAMRKDARLEDVPVIILTGIGDVGTIHEGLNRGADEYMIKPVKSQDLIQTIRALLKKGAGSSSATESVS